MSFDEKQHLDSDEIDLGELVKSIWFYKFSLLLFVILSIPISIIFSNTIQPTYKAKTVFERPTNKSVQGNNALLNNIEGLGFLSYLGGSIGTRSDSIFSEIRSDSLMKTVILDNPELDSQMLQEYCPLPSKETSRITLKSLLVLLGLSEYRVPSENQKNSLLVQCVNNMMEMEYDSPGSDTGNAFRLSVTSPDPTFSANLANQIVKKYFVRHEREETKIFKI